MKYGLFIIYVDSKNFVRENVKALVCAETEQEAVEKFKQHMTDTGKKLSDYFMDEMTVEWVELYHGLVWTV